MNCSNKFRDYARFCWILNFVLINQFVHVWGTTAQWVWLEHSYLSCAGISFLYHLHQYNLLLFPHKWRAYKKLIKAEIYVWVENCCSSFELVQKVKYYSIFLKFGKFLLLLFFLFSHHCLCIMMLDFRFHFLTFNKKVVQCFFPF